MSSNTGRTDLHSHLFPGVDDGARNLEDARAGLLALQQAGVNRVVTTPHFAASFTDDILRFDRVMDRMDAAWEALEALARAEFPGMTVARGQEVALDKPDMTFEDSRLRLAGTSFALVEWPRFNPPPAAPLALRRIRDLGVLPLVAHAERYQGAVQNLSRIAAWREAGAYMQVNYGSLVGQYGPEARAAAHRMLERGWVDVLASDLHPVPGFQLYIEPVQQLLEEAGGLEQLELLTVTNPGRILDDQEPLPAAPMILTEGIWERFRRFLRRKKT